MEAESYTPRTWRTHPLHICPPEPYSPSHPRTRECMDWIFLISSLNFSFWSEKDGKERYGVEWRESWDSASKSSTVHTGYWSLVAAIDRGKWTVIFLNIIQCWIMLYDLVFIRSLALDEGIPFTDPAFYSSETRCTDSSIAHIFRAATDCKEDIPLLKERIAILRENGSILCKVR